MKVKILELGKTLFDGDAAKIILPATEGEMCILPEHISIFTSLEKGAIKVFRPGIDKPVTIHVESGVCSFSNNRAVCIL